MSIRRRHSRAGWSLLDVVLVVFMAAIVAALVIPSRCGRAGLCARERNAGAALKQLTTHEAVWRTQDQDRNGMADFWTRDVAAFHGLAAPDGRPVAYIDLAFARADAAPGAAYPALGGVSVPKQGYRYQAMTTDERGRPYVDPASRPPRAPNAPSGPCTNPSGFGFTAFPAIYNSDGVLTFMVNEGGVVWQKDTGVARPILQRALAAPPGADRGWSEFGG